MGADHATQKTNQEEDEMSGTEHYPGCPCHDCVTIRAARPQPPVPLAYLACCGATVKLTRGRPGQYAGHETHSSHCEYVVAPFMPKEGL